MRPVAKGGELDEQRRGAVEDRGRGSADQGHRRGSTHAGRRPPPRSSKLFLTIAQQASAGASIGLRRLRLLHEAIVDREEQGETLVGLLPGGLAEKVRLEGHRIGETENLHVTVLMSDIRGYTTIAEYADPAGLARQLNTHRAR